MEIEATITVQMVTLVENPRRSVVDLTKGYAKEDQAVSTNTGVPSQSVANSDMEHIYVENDQMRRKLQ